MNCPRCGTPMSGGVCPECGFPVTGVKTLYITDVTKVEFIPVKSEH